MLHVIQSSLWGKQPLTFECVVSGRGVRHLFTDKTPLFSREYQDEN